MVEKNVPRPTKRARLTEAAARIVHQQGVERTTISDIAQAADVPVGNVYYYFKTKDDLVAAAVSEQARQLELLTGHLNELPDPRERLKALINQWGAQGETAARYGCPTGTLAAELDKRAEAGLDAEVGNVIRALLDWVAAQFQELGVPKPQDKAIALVGAYQGMSVLANALREPDIMKRESARLIQQLDAIIADTR
ncbi:MAG: TetR/AcrR family transcriptional regulator [Corynebacteriales bacterium]|nr:TetR/AcrR family transcriptional regulator [Mycobacteriales bacterium]